jgi:hypothetical protein
LKSFPDGTYGQKIYYFFQSPVKSKPFYKLANLQITC